MNFNELIEALKNLNFSQLSLDEKKQLLSTLKGCVELLESSGVKLFNLPGWK